MKKLLTFFVVILVLGGACIDPVDLRVDSMANKLVVDGVITNLAGQYTVKISRSLNFDSKRVPRIYVVPEKDAAVTIEDGEGNVYPLTEVSKGVYKTAAGQVTGEIGETYTLKITTSDGKNYVSRPEIMPAAPLIDSILYKYHIYERLIINSSGNPVVDKQYGFLLSVMVNDPANERNYYRWKSNGIFEYFSITDNPEIKQCWAPVFILENVVTIKDDRHINGNTFTNEISIVPYERETRFMARVEQHSLTQQAFEFWDAVAKQQSGTGSIFDPAPGQARGNMYSADDENEVVFGYFGASAIAKDSVMIDRFKASGYVSASPRVPPEFGDCRNHVPFGTNIRPPGF